MFLGKKLVVVLPAYNAELTLEKTINEIPSGFVDQIILVDDSSTDSTFELANKLGLLTLKHEKNKGYGGNQKSCYKLALDSGADIVIMLHPDYQYDPRLVPAMAAMVGSGIYDLVLASRILGKGALRGGMPLYKYFFNRALTAFQNIMINLKLSEYHTGYRAYSRELLEKIPFELNSDDFIFDNQLIVQAKKYKFNIGEISCPTKYFPEASSINFSRSCKYGFGVIACSFKYVAYRWGLYTSRFLRD